MPISNSLFDKWTGVIAKNSSYKYTLSQRVTINMFIRWIYLGLGSSGLKKFSGWNYNFFLPFSQSFLTILFLKGYNCLWHRSYLFLKTCFCPYWYFGTAGTLTSSTPKLFSRKLDLVQSVFIKLSFKFFISYDSKVFDFWNQQLIFYLTFSYRAVDFFCS